MEILRTKSLPNASTQKVGAICILENGYIYVLSNKRQWIKLNRNSLEIFKENLATKNLNDVTENGVYFQYMNIDALGSRNYPTEQAGMLEVRVLNDNNIYQSYTVLAGQNNENRVYKRGRYVGVWSSWKSANYFSLSQAQVDNIIAEKHTHSNKQLLDGINQDVKAGASPSFESVKTGSVEYSAKGVTSLDNRNIKNNLISISGADLSLAKNTESSLYVGAGVKGSGNILGVDNLGKVVKTSISAPDLSGYVNLTGVQTITGQKTFNNIKIDGNIIGNEYLTNLYTGKFTVIEPGFHHQFPNGTTTQNIYDKPFKFPTRTAWFSASQDNTPSNDSYGIINVSAKDAGSTVWQIAGYAGKSNTNTGLWYRAGKGNVWSTDKVGTNNGWIKILTTEDFNTKDYVNLNSNQTITGSKTFTGTQKFSNIQASGDVRANNILTSGGVGIGVEPSNSVNIAIVENNTGFKNEGNGNLSYYTKGTKKYSLNDVYHSGNLNPNSFVTKEGADLNGGGKIDRYGNIKHKAVPDTNAIGSFALNKEKTDNDGGIGYLFKDEKLQYLYVGWGITPWSETTSLIVSENQFTYKGNTIYHSGNLDLSNVLRNDGIEFNGGGKIDQYGNIWHRAVGTSAAIGSFARDRKTNNNDGGIGYKYSAGVLDYMYMGWGNTPENENNNFRVDSSGVYYKTAELWGEHNLIPVTTNTEQTITGSKTFNNLQYFIGGINTTRVNMVRNHNKGTASGFVAKDDDVWFIYNKNDSYKMSNVVFSDDNNTIYEKYFYPNKQSFNHLDTRDLEVFNNGKIFAKYGSDDKEVGLLISNGDIEYYTNEKTHFTFKQLKDALKRLEAIERRLGM